MKYGQFLSDNLVPEWRIKYIDYKKLRKLIEQFIQVKEEYEVTSQEYYKIKKEKFEIDFLKEVDKELEKVTKFYESQISEDKLIFKNLKDNWKAVKRENDKKIQAKKEKNLQTANAGFFEKAALCIKKEFTEPFHITKNVASNVAHSKYFHHTFNALHLTHQTILEKMEQAITEYYWNITMLSHYVILNREGFRKILKKFDKNLAVGYDVDPDMGEDERMCTKGKDYYNSLIIGKNDSFYNDETLKNLTKDTEIIARELNDGDMKKAMSKLRVPRGPLEKGQPVSNVQIFILGLLLGTLFSLTVILSYRFIDNDSNDVPSYVSNQAWEYFRFYRPGLYLCVFMYFMAVDIWSFDLTGINYTLIFGVDPRNQFSYIQIFCIATLMSISLILSFYIELFLFPNDDITEIHNPGIIPLCLYISWLGILFLPLPILFGPTRLWIIEKIGRAFSCGLLEVKFVDFWLADQFNSLANFFVDLGMIFCISGRSLETFGVDGIDDKSIPSNVNNGTVQFVDFIITPENEFPVPLCKDDEWRFKLALAFLPPLMRFGQCIRRWLDLSPTRSDFKLFPHIWNAGKYATGMFKVIAAALYIKYGDTAWTFSLLLTADIIGTICTMLWDYIMDWGFFSKESFSKKFSNRFLRDKLVLEHNYFYYFAIINNFILRWIWVVSITLSKTKVTEGKEIWVGAIFTCLEIYRRGCWNFIRLENEHLHNCGDFRVMRFDVKKGL